MLFIFAWSSVMLNMRPVYEWMTRAVFDYSTPRHSLMSMTSHSEDQPPKLDWRAAQAVGERLMAEQASGHWLCGRASAQPHIRSILWNLHVCREEQPRRGRSERRRYDRVRR